MMTLKQLEAVSVRFNGRRRLTEAVLFKAVLLTLTVATVVLVEGWL